MKCSSKCWAAHVVFTSQSAAVSVTMQRQLSDHTPVLLGYCVRAGRFSRGRRPLSDPRCRTGGGEARVDRASQRVWQHASFGRSLGRRPALVTRRGLQALRLGEPTWFKITAVDFVLQRHRLKIPLPTWSSVQRLRSSLRVDLVGDWVNDASQGIEVSELFLSWSWAPNVSGSEKDVWRPRKTVVTLTPSQGRAMQTLKRSWDRLLLLSVMDGRSRIDGSTLACRRGR